MAKTTKEAPKKAKAAKAGKADPKLAIERTVYVLAPRKRVWRALTAPLETPHYYYSTRLETKLRRGEPFRYMQSDGKVAIDGEVSQVEEEAKLVHTFAFPHHRDAPSRVTYSLSDVGPKITKLDLVHDGFPRVNETYREVLGGWDKLLSSLKTYIETGKGLEWPPGSGM